MELDETSIMPQANKNVAPIAPSNVIDTVLNNAIMFVLVRKALFAINVIIHINKSGIKIPTSFRLVIFFMVSMCNLLYQSLYVSTFSAVTVIVPVS